MNYQHQNLAAGRWQRLTFFEQMANIASEVERSLNWRTRNNPGYSQRAFERALELLDLTLAGAKRPSALKELARVREALVDFFSGKNEYASSDVAWRKYFSPFTSAARRKY